jgi:hypothetical protein
LALLVIAEAAAVSEQRWASGVEAHIRRDLLVDTGAPSGSARSLCIHFHTHTRCAVGARPRWRCPAPQHRRRLPGHGATLPAAWCQQPRSFQPDGARFSGNRPRVLRVSARCLGSVARLGFSASRLPARLAHPLSTGVRAPAQRRQCTQGASRAGANRARRGRTRAPGAPRARAGRRRGPRSLCVVRSRR